MRKTIVQVDGRKLALSNLDKVLYPETGFTKAGVLDYYRRVAPALLPHLRDRPVTMKRYPEGVDQDFFYEKRCPGHRPEWVQTVEISEKVKSPLRFCVVNDQATLIWLANLASIELHTYLYKGNVPNRPSFIVFDLDPGEPAGFFDCIKVALTLRDILHTAGLKTFPKTSGGKGLHFYVPLNTAVTFEQTKSAARAIAQAIERRMPEKVTSSMKKSAREGKVFVDWSQNDQNKTTVCAYSLRALSRPTVSTPMLWKELEQALQRRRTSPPMFEADAVLRRIEKHGDLFADVLKLRQRLPAGRAQVS